ncbi:hypothetical protein E1742_13445 [Pseudoduganella plicata]|uniref:HlyD family secretion protein n=1 Tax=Pseudoduganella plicata TaxID=321984 RepID=A0ABX5SC14_9BURK|nr:hypothetical protein E1742_13445 [Pseudoduganella plicata]
MGVQAGEQRRRRQDVPGPHQLDGQQLVGPGGEVFRLAAGMQVVAEIQQGQRTVLEYLTSPVKNLWPVINTHLPTRH